MKITVRKFLNIRVGKPSINAPCYQYLAPGSEIEVDGKLYKGDEYDKIDTWFKDAGNNYYWSGGMINIYPWWISDYGIDNIWNYTKGGGIKVAVLDTGLGNNDNLNIKNISGKNFCDDNDDYSENADDHGTLMTGIISGKGPTVYGLAPDASVLMYKVIKNDKLCYEGFVKALTACLNENVDIINISLAITPADYNANIQVLSKIEPLIQELVKKGVFIIAASGNLAIELDCIPANNAGCISVTAIDQNQTLYKNACTSKHIALAAPGVKIVSTSINNKFPSNSGTSEATAYISGFLALMKSYMLKNNTWDYKKVNQLLKDPMVYNNPKNYAPMQSGNGILNPTAFFNKIK